MKMTTNMKFRYKVHIRFKMKSKSSQWTRFKLKKIRSKFLQPGTSIRSTIPHNKYLKPLHLKNRDANQPPKVSYGTNNLKLIRPTMDHPERYLPLKTTPIINSNLKSILGKAKTKTW